MQNSSRDDLAGRTLGEFVVREQIGSGGFGAVYRAVQPQLGREAVIKILHLRHRASDVAVQRFLREARLASLIDHPFAAHIYAFGAESDGLLWIAMELVRGTSLDAHLRAKGPLSVEELVPFLERLCEVVHTAHEQGIVHRDIKPSNVMMLSRAGRSLPKLLDLGIAKLLPGGRELADAPARDLDISPEADTIEAGPSSECELDVVPTPVGAAGHSASGESTPSTSTLTGAETFLGSPPYMAPEVWRSAAAAGPPSDIYALGVLAYETLTGDRPFTGRNQRAIGYAHRTNPMPPLGPSFSDAVDAVLRRALAKNPDDRFASALEFSAALRVAAGMADPVTNLPQLPESVRELWVGGAPQPLAEAVADLDAARNPHQAADSLTICTRAVVRYLAALALASRTRGGQLSGASDPQPVVQLLRELRQHELDDTEWVSLVTELVRPFASKPAAHPVPELVGLFFAEDGPRDPFRTLLDLPLRPLASSSAVAPEDAFRELLAKRVAALADVLRSAAFVLDYPIGVARNGTFESWCGVRPRRRMPLHLTEATPDDRPVLIDRSGRATLALWPIVQVAPPAPGAPDEMFLFDGKGRLGARLVAPPAGFERHDDDVWPWVGEHLIESLDTTSPLAGEPTDPYPGLAPFTVADADRFVGREREAEAILNRLRAEPLLAIVGPSGVGKSSLVHAGVVPNLPTGWRAVTLRPGFAPLASLHTRLRAAKVDLGDDPAACSPEAIARAARLAGERDGMLVIVIDQFEELFTLCESPTERTAYADCLSQLARSPDDAVRVAITLRDDFLVKAEQLPALRNRLARSLLLLTVPQQDDLRRIVVEPAQRAGYSFDDPELPDEMIAAVTGKPGALPLLSFTAARLWHLRDRHFQRLTRDAYESMGGVAGALARHAETTLEQMIGEERSLVRNLFRHLVTGDGTRARVARSDLRDLLGNRVDHVVEKLVGARLLVATEDDDGSDRVEIIHEALLAEWDTLKGWLAEDQEARLARTRVAAAAAEWERLGRTREALWGGKQMRELERVEVRDLAARESAFVRASQRLIRRGRWRRRLILGGIPVAVVLVLVVIRLAQQAELESRARQEVGEAESVLAEARRLEKSAGTERRTAFARFDAGDVAAGEEGWARARTDAAAADRALGRASQILEAALKIDPSSTQVAAAFADVLYERAMQAERERRSSQYQELLQRLALYDESGDRRAKLAMPGHLSVETDPSGAEVMIERHERDPAGRRLPVDVRELGAAPLTETELAQGSYVLTLTATGRATVRYPLVLARGEELEVSVALPAAERIPNGFVYVPPGRFLVGTADEGMRDFLNSVPLHEMTTHGYLISRTEVTYAQWIEFLRDLSPEERTRRTPRVAEEGFHGALELKELDDGAWQLTVQPSGVVYKVRTGQHLRYAERDRRAEQDWTKLPVGGVSYDDAEAYAAWLRRSGRVPDARLCTEVEWERAARGADDREYPHGDTLQYDDANHDATYGKKPGGFGPDEVGSHPASRSPFGVEDMAGNVWEWTSSVFGHDLRVARGGSFYFSAKSSRSTNREATDPTLRSATLGVRVCADLR